MTRNTHRFPCGGEIIESYYVICTPDEWAASPQSREHGWSVWRGPSVVFANKLALPGGVLIPRGPAVARPDKPV